MRAARPLGALGFVRASFGFGAIVEDSSAWPISTRMREAHIQVLLDRSLVTIERIGNIARAQSRDVLRGYTSLDRASKDLARSAKWSNHFRWPLFPKK